MSATPAKKPSPGKEHLAATPGAGSGGRPQTPPSQTPPVARAPAESGCRDGGPPRVHHSAARRPTPGPLGVPVGGPVGNLHRSPFVGRSATRDQLLSPFAGGPSTLLGGRPQMGRSTQHPAWRPHLPREDSNDNRGEGYDRGYAAGKDEGYKDGEQAGYAKGYAKGEADGERTGYQNGKRDGFNEGEKVGFQEGKAEGMQEGYFTGMTEGLAAACAHCDNPRAHDSPRSSDEEEEEEPPITEDDIPDSWYD